MRRVVLLVAVGVGLAGPARAQNDYGTHGFLDRVSKGTEEVDHCPAAPGVDAEARTKRSSSHYKRGAVLYEQGDYQGAVREFVAGYCDQPHHDFYYNIGQSFERLLDYEKAVAYLERFILEADAEAKNRPRAALRVEVLRNLPGRINVATVPPHATITLSSDTGITAETEANRAPIPIRRGSYTLRVELPGYEPIEQPVVVEIGQPYSFYFRLEPRKGSLHVSASPADARLFLGDRLVGIGSYVETVPIGAYTLTVEREGRQSVRRELTVEPDRPTEVGVALPERPRSGRAELIAATTVGVGLTSAGTLGTLLDQDGGVATAGTLLGLGLGFGAAYLGIPADLPIGHSSFIIGSTAIGALDGLLIASAFTCDHGGDGADAAGTLDTCDADVLAGVTMTGGALGLLVGALAAPRLELDAGDAALVNSGAMWGGVAGAMFFAAFDSDTRIREPLLLAGLNLGLVAGATLAARTTVSRGRMALIDLSGLAGIIAGVAVGQSFDSGSERLNHFALVGMAAGLITGTFLTRSMDEAGLDSGTIRPTVSTDGVTTTVGIAAPL